MKKITLKINGKEQTLTVGSVVEVTMKRGCQIYKNYRYVGYIFGEQKEFYDFCLISSTKEPHKNIEVFFEEDIKSIKELK